VESGWCDYVFDEKYDLRPLQEVAQFISENKHTCQIFPPPVEVETNGISLGDMSNA
jgi:hypothetical protein